MRVQYAAENRLYGSRSATVRRYARSGPAVAATGRRGAFVDGERVDLRDDDGLAGRRGRRDSLRRPLLEAAVARDVERDRPRACRQRHRLVRVRVDRMLPVLLVPVGHLRVLVHVLDDLPPADAGVVRAEGDLAHLRCVGDDAHLGAAEIVSPEILEPHAGDEEQQPLVALAVLVVARAEPAAELAAALFVELVQQIDETEAGGRLQRLVVAQQTERGLREGERAAARAVGNRDASLST